MPITDKSARERFKGQSKKKKYMLVVFTIVLSAAAAALFLFPGASSGEGEASRLLDFNTVTKGVRVGGIDISGMTGEEALAAASGIPESLLGGIKVTIDVNGTVFEYGAGEAGIDTDYEEAISRAIIYGRTGTYEQRKRCAYAAMNGSVNFNVKVRADEQSVKTALEPLKRQMDKPPVDAAYVFTPGGHAADGTPYDTGAKNKKPVRIPEGSMPGAIRYQYYRTDKYVKNYIPKDASVSRFFFTEQSEGVLVDIDALAAQIVGAVKTGQYSIKAPAQILKPTIFIDSVKYATQLVSSWTSSYESHDNPERNYNIAKLSAIINGVVIEPGDTWSINEQAGARTYKNGWKEAPGILKGAFVDGPGGGVCQVSSTLYNAALRAGLKVESSRHSIISNYIPLGLDATISSGGKDLKLSNPYESPVFIVSYVNPKDKNVTVEIYGPPVMDAAYGQVVLSFSSKVTARTEMPDTQKHYNAASTPDEKRIEPGKSRIYVKPRKGTTAQVYIHYLSLDGKELDVKKFYVAKYPRIKGQEYINDAPPQ